MPHQTHIILSLALVTFSCVHVSARNIHRNEVVNVEMLGGDHSPSEKFEGSGIKQPSSQLEYDSQSEVINGEKIPRITILFSKNESSVIWEIIKFVFYCFVVFISVLCFCFIGCGMSMLIFREKMKDQDKNLPGIDKIRDNIQHFKDAITTKFNN